MTLAILGYAGLESFAWRRVLFGVGLLGALALFIGSMGNPLANWFRVRSRADFKLWARWAGQRQPGVAEEAANLVDLDLSLGKEKSPLLAKAVEERGASVSSLPWKREYALRELRKDALWLVLPLGALLLIQLSGRWEVLRTGSQSVLAYNRPLAPPPFVFDSIGLPQHAIEGEKVHIVARLSGRSLPDRLWFSVSQGERVLMKATSTGTYEASWTARTGTHEIRLETEHIKSEPRSVEVFGEAGLWVQEVRYRFPAYTGMESRVGAFESAVVVPRGTQIDWIVETRNVVLSTMLWEDEFGPKEISSRKQVLDRGRVVFSYEGAYGQKGNSLHQDIEVIGDEPPRIDVIETRSSDSSRYVLRFADDYGFRGLYVEFERADQEPLRELVRKPSGLSGEAVLEFSIEELLRSSTKSLRFVLEDNDAISGFKESKSPWFVFEIIDDLERLDRASQSMGTWSSANKESKDAEDKAEQLEQGLKMESVSALNWKQKNAVVEQREALRKEREQRAQRLENMAKALDEIDKTRAEDERDKELREEMQRASESLDRDLSREQLEKQKERAAEMLKKLSEERQKAEEERMSEERLLELLKRESVDAQFGALREEVRALSVEERKLSEESAGAKEQEAQEALKRRMEDVNAKYEELLQENRSLEKPFEIEELKGDRLEAEQKMKEAAEQSKKGDGSENKMQKESAESLEKLAEQMDAMSASMDAAAQMENIQDLKQILDNLLVYSRGQEALSAKLQRMSPSEPGLERSMAEEQRLIQGSRIIQDSLQALAKRTPMVGQKIFEELGKMDQAAQRSAEEMAEREIARASSSTRYAMTAANELAVMLDQSLQNMQSMMQESSGKGQCSKPGGSKPSPGQSNKPSPSKMKALQEQLMKGMEGQKGKEGEDGEEGKGEKGKGRRSQSKSAGEYGELLRQQEELRRMLESLLESEEAGINGSTGQKMLEMMKESERELAEQRLQPRSLSRQKEIMSRLLESEKAERSRGEDEKRESKEGQVQQEAGSSWKEKDPQSLDELEGLKLDPIRFSPYYRERILEWQTER